MSELRDAILEKLRETFGEEFEGIAPDDRLIVAPESWTMRQIGELQCLFDENINQPAKRIIFLPHAFRGLELSRNLRPDFLELAELTSRLIRSVDERFTRVGKIDEFNRDLDALNALIGRMRKRDE